MANETSTTTLTVNVPTEAIEAIILNALRPNIVVAPLVQKGYLALNSGKVWQQTKFPTITAASVGETTDSTPTARTTTLEANITIGEVIVNTKVTDLARETTVGDAANPEAWARQSGQAIAQKMDGDLCALFAGLNSSSAVGSTGVDLNVAVFIEAIYTLENSNVPGAKSCVLHPIQKFDLFTNMVSTSNAGALHTNLAELVREGKMPSGSPMTGFWGIFCGVPIWITSEVVTANSDADRVGAMFAAEAMALVQLTPVRVEYDRDGSWRVTEIIGRIVYGVGENDEARGVPILSDA